MKQTSGESRGLLSFVVPDAYVVAGRIEGVPGYVEPVGGGEELVGMRATSEKVDEVLELGWVLGMDVGGLADEVLGVLDAANEAVDPTVAEAGVDDDGVDLKAGRLQEHQAAVGQVGHDLHRGDVVGVFAQIEELAQQEVS